MTQYSASYPTAAALRARVAPGTTLVVTDENRDRARIWSSVLDNVGYTEQAGEKPLVDDPNDARLPVFPGEPADALTTTQQRGVKTIQASAYGNTITYTPEDRAARGARRRHLDRVARRGARAMRSVSTSACSSTRRSRPTT